MEQADLDYTEVVNTAKVINSKEPQNLALDGIHPSVQGFTPLPSK